MQAIDRNRYGKDHAEHPQTVQQIFNMIDSFVLVKDQRVLDMACGNGHFAREFWMRQANVVAVDFISELIESAKNIQKQTGDNIRYITHDATTQKAKKTFDIVFVNQLLMYLNEQSLAKFFGSLKKLTNSTSLVLIRETCRAVGVSTTNEKEILRSWRSYEDIFEFQGLKVLRKEHIRYFEREYNDPNQCVWLLKWRDNVKNIEYIKGGKKKLSSWNPSFGTFPQEVVQVLDALDKFVHVKAKRVLEIDCKEGRWSRELYWRGASITCVEMDDELLLEAKS